MSGKLMGLVYDIVLSHGEQAIMLALADHGEVDVITLEDGRAVQIGVQIFPGQDRLMHKTGYDRRNVQRILDQLEASGLLVPVGGIAVGRGHAQEYEMHLYRGTQKPPFTREKAANEAQPRKRRQMKQQKAANEATKGGISTQKAANEATKGGLYTAPTVLTVREPKREPSETPTHARAREPSPPPENFWDGYHRWLRQQPGGAERFDKNRREKYLHRYEAELERATQ